MTNAELHELTFIALAQVDTYFQFWLTSTFAVILVGFLASHHLTRGLACLVTVLYLLASFLFLMRINLAGDMYAQYVAAITELPFPVETTESFIFMRLLVFFGGTLSAVVYLWIALFKGEKRPSEET